MNKEKFTAIHLSRATQSQKITAQVEQTVRAFLASGKPHLEVTFHTPETLTQKSRILELEAQMKRYREALEKLSHSCRCEEYNELCDCSSRMMRAAREALKEDA